MSLWERILTRENLTEKKKKRKVNGNVEVKRAK
jgi:hypothetical protein